MSIAVSGKPGGSKTYFVVERILEELVTTEKPIVTNIPLDFDGIKAWLKNKGRGDIDLSRRIQILAYDDVKSFWRFRGPLVEPLPDITEEQCKQGKMPDLGAIEDDGVFYALDEWHEHANSRQWKKTGPVVLFYIAKHRHLKDEVYWITQAIKNVDSQWRDKTQEYIYCRNNGKERIKGFTKGKAFVATSYLEPWTPGSTQPEQWTKTRQLDKAVARCYRTSMYGKGAEEVRVKGMHYAWLCVGILALMGVAWYVTGLIPAAVGGGKKPETQVTQNIRELESQGGKAWEPVKPAPLETPDLQDEPYNVVAVPLQFSSAHRLVGKLSEAKQSGGAAFMQCDVRASEDDRAVILGGNKFNQLVGLAETIRQMDVASALVSIRCVVARRVKSANSTVGLWEYLRQAASSDLALSAVLDGLAIDAATGVVTMGATIAARQAVEVITQFVAGDGHFDVMASPNMAVRSGREAVFTAGREVPVPTTVRDASGSETSIQFKQAVFSFKVRPTVLKSGRVLLELLQENSDVIETTVIAGNATPVLSTQTLRTEVELGETQLMYVGGIETTMDQRAEKGTPFLRKIPGVSLVLGTQEKKVERGELFVVLSVSVYREGTVPERIERAVPVRRAKRADRNR